MNGWEQVTAIVGVAAVIGSTWVSIHKGKAKSLPNEASRFEARMVKLESEIDHTKGANLRLEREQADTRRRQEEVVDGIYQAINELRKEIMEYLKKGRS